MNEFPDFGFQLFAVAAHLSGHLFTCHSFNVNHRQSAPTLVPTLCVEAANALQIFKNLHTLLAVCSGDSRWGCAPNSYSALPPPPLPPPPDYTVEEQPSEMVLIQELESGRAKPVVFVLNANLLAMIKLVNCMSPLLHVCRVR